MKIIGSNFLTKGAELHYNVKYWIICLNMKFKIYNINGGTHNVRSFEMEQH